MSDSQKQPDSTPDTGHEYDGIREYDNPLPGWWVWIFWITIFWSAGYLFLAFLPPKIFSGETSLVVEKQEINNRLFGSLGELTMDDATILEYSKDPKWTVIGRNVFSANCVACHGTEAQGMVGSGPNLTDDVYLHVKTPADIADVIAKGRKNGAMPPWEKTIERNKLVMLAAYVTSLRGKNASGKPAEGTAPAIKWGQ